tara:strand:+ start:20310 stop:23534 length:3225 start_codon:yes stop_codon:yes gene_type:complete
MAKDKVSVPSIQIGGNKQGLAFGGVIYSADSQVGYNGDPTKLNVNVALDTKISGGNIDKRDFDITKNDLNLTSPIDIKFAGSPMFRNMFLTSYNTSTSVGNKLLNLTYSDGSVLLDRVFVGLIHEHFHIGAKGSANGTEPLRSKYEVPYMIEMKVKCPKPESHIVTEGTTKVTYTVCSATDTTVSKRKTLRYLANPTGVPGLNYKLRRQDGRSEVGIWSGGYIVLGKEEFSSSNCDLSDVSYSFADLIAAVRAFKIKVDLTRYPERRDNQHMTKRYSGTLKDVLQNWGNDLGVSFYWDFTSQRPALSIVDLTDKSIQAKFQKAISSIDGLDRGHGMSMSEGTNLVINEKNHSNSLDGTFSQAYSSIFNRGPSAKKDDKKTTTEVSFSCQKLEALSGGRNKILGRHTSSDFFTSMTLGKYAPDLRDAFNARTAIAAYEKGLWKASYGYFNAIGFSEIIPLTFGKRWWEARSGIKEKILADSAVKGIMDHRSASYSQGEMPVGPNGATYHIFFGIYDESVKEYSNSLEQQIASDYYGRNYTLSVPAAEFFQCNKAFKILETLETKPSSEYYGANQHYKTPMAKFLQKLEDLSIDSLESSGKLYVNHLLDDNKKLRNSLVRDGACGKGIFTERRQNGFFHFDRQAPWMASRNDVESLLNPYTLQPRNPQLFADGGYYKEHEQPRVKKNIIKEYLPFTQEMMALSQILGSLRAGANSSIGQAVSMMSSSQSSGKDVRLCMVLSNEDGSFSNRKIGDIRITKPHYAENIIEELNALSSICSRSSEVAPKDTENCTTVCEGDLVESLCNSDLFGQAELSCGEAQAIKDSAYSTEMSAIGNKITGRRITLRRKSKKVSGQLFYADAEKVAGGVNNAVSITAPSENNHKGVLIYNRNSTYTDLGVRKVFDGIDSNFVPISPKTSSIKYQTQDITQDVSSIFSEDNRAKIIEGEIPIDILADLTGEITKEGDRSYLNLQNIKASEYHNLLKNNMSSAQVDTVREEVNYKIYLDGAGGMEGLMKYLKQENGLHSLTITSDDSGYYLNVTFSNRPPVQPELEAIYRKVGPISRSVQPKNAFYKSM